MKETDNSARWSIKPYKFKLKPIRLIFSRKWKSILERSCNKLNKSNSSNPEEEGNRVFLRTETTANFRSRIYPQALKFKKHRSVRSKISLTLSSWMKRSAFTRKRFHRVHRNWQEFWIFTASMKFPTLLRSTAMERSFQELWTSVARKTTRRSTAKWSPWTSRSKISCRRLVLLLKNSKYCDIWTIIIWLNTSLYYIDMPKEGQKEWEVEKIIQRGEQQGKTFYLVKWKGYPLKEATW